MFLINQQKNEAVSIPKKTFSELNFKERQNLQEWIDKNPQILGEDLLIIQKEFSGFSDTSERLDLLALDENGNLVVIENKLDDSGRDVVWQALKYVSYCASLSANQIKDIYQKYLRSKGLEEDAEEKILEFLNTSDFDEAMINRGDQRIILVAAQFRKEVTSTVMWLMRHQVNCKCIKVTPYQNGDEIYLDTEQILPAPDTEELQIKMNQKEQEDNLVSEELASRHKQRLAFWTKALPELQNAADTYHNVSPSKENALLGATGVPGIYYNCVITYEECRVELYFGRSGESGRYENKYLFDELYKQKPQLDEAFGQELHWERIEHAKASKIVLYNRDVGLTHRDEWPEIIRFMTQYVVKMKDVFLKPLQDANTKLKSAVKESES